jgi:hypothetical protein
MRVTRRGQKVLYSKIVVNSHSHPSYQAHYTLIKGLLDGVSRQDDPASLGQPAPIPVVSLGHVAVDLCGRIYAQLMSTSARRRWRRAGAMTNHRIRPRVRRNSQIVTEIRHTAKSGIKMSSLRARHWRWLRGTTRRQRRESRSGHSMPVRK